MTVRRREENASPKQTMREAGLGSPSWKTLVGLFTLRDMSSTVEQSLADIV